MLGTAIILCWFWAGRGGGNNTAATNSTIEGNTNSASHPGSLQEGLPMPASLAEVMQSTRQMLIEQSAECLHVCFLSYILIVCFGDQCTTFSFVDHDINQLFEVYFLFLESCIITPVVLRFCWLIFCVIGMFSYILIATCEATWESSKCDRSIFTDKYSNNCMECRSSTA